MKARTWLVVIALVIAILGFVLYRKTSAPTASPGAQHGGAAAGSAIAAAPGPHTGSASPPPAHVTRLASPAERTQIAERIEAAHAQRARQAVPRPPSLPDSDSHDLELATPQLKAALNEVIPLLAECYQRGSGASGDRRPAFNLTLTSDPEVGTLIDADRLVDRDGKPLDPELGGCLRTTLDSLELPPLGVSATLHLQYSFRFDD